MAEYLPQISIIIPVFNASSSLSRCINSILDQSFSNYELLLIDDGSSDGSRDICEDYARRDKRIRVFCKTNGGVSSARNLGIENSKGDYIMFIDADDYVGHLYIEHLMIANSDLVLSGIQKFGANNDSKKPGKYSSFVINELPFYWNTPPKMNYLYCYPFSKRFKSSIIRENHIRFNESLFFSEDMCFNMLYMSFSNTVTEIPFSDYMYHIESISRNERYKMSVEQLINHYEYSDACFDQLYKSIGNRTLSFVQDNTNLRLMRKLCFFLLHCENATVFKSNIRKFRDLPWSGYMMSLLTQKREKRVMKEAIRFPLITYFVEIRFRNLIYKYCFYGARR